MYQLKSDTSSMFISENIASTNIPNSGRTCFYLKKINYQPTKDPMGRGERGDKQNQKRKRGWTTRCCPGQQLRNALQQKEMQQSIVDANPKAYSNGTNLPMQYLRRNNEEVAKIFNKTFTQLNFKKAKGNENYYSTIVETKGKDCSANIEANAHEAQLTHRTIQTSGCCFQLKNSSERKFDIWKPLGYDQYELQLMNCKKTNDTHCSNSIFRHKFSIKSQRSDIFFQENVEQPNVERKISNENYRYQDSDIHFLKNNIVSLNKTGEKHLFRDPNKTVYNSSNKSNSEWHAKNSMPNLLNCASSEYHILSPGIKHISKTKDEIFKMYSCQDKNSAMLNFTPIHRQKAICEFLDITRVSGPKPNKDYLEIFNKSSNAFKKNSNLCSNFLDLHKVYKDICGKPF